MGGSGNWRGWLVGLAGVALIVGGTIARDSATIGRPGGTEGLSAEQAEVWKQELEYFRSLQAKDLKRHMALWDDRFVGWPDYRSHPVRKAQIEADIAEEIRTASANVQPTAAPTPESVEVYGEVAITYYYWPEANESSATRYRITHTWKRTAAGWKIIGGMSCGVPREKGNV